MKTNNNLTLNRNTTIPRTNKLNLDSGYNYYDKSLINLNSTILKGYIPFIQISGTSISLPFKNYNETYSDYVGFKYVSSNDEIINITTARILSNNKAYTNINIEFKFNQTNYTNYSITHQFDSIGQFSIYVYSSFGGNILALIDPINIQCVDTFTRMSNV